MAQPILEPIAKYDGNYITCYPSSNATDDGKLNLEFNMARLVTRVSSKNFCVKNPSFGLEAYMDPISSSLKIKVGTGEASINGMDLIATQELLIDPPKEAGEFYLAFKLARNDQKNVLGDFTYGSSVTFQGVYLAYFNEKDTADMDMLYLGKVTWDGENFTSIEEDEDKYGRIWAEDIMCKLEDPKHPDERRLNLQEYIYKLPDWYFSKEGDIIYGPLIIADNRENSNPGIIMNVDEDGSHITIKDPSTDNDKLQFYGDVNRDGVIDENDLQMIQDYLDGEITFDDLQKILGDVNHDGVIDELDLLYISNFITQEGNSGDTGNIYYIDDSTNVINIDTTSDELAIEIGEGKIYENLEDKILNIFNTYNMNIRSYETLHIQGDEGVEIGTGGAGTSPLLVLQEHHMTVTDSNSSDLKYDINFISEDVIQETIGKAIWEYNDANKKLSLLTNNVNNFEIRPNAIFKQNVNVLDTMYFGSDDNSSTTYLNQNNWRISNPDNPAQYTDFTYNKTDIVNDTTTGDGNSRILLRNSANTIYSQLENNGKLTLVNNNDTAGITFGDGTSTNDVKLYKLLREKKLKLEGSLGVTNDIVADGLITGNGLKTSNGVLTFSRGSNDATITKDNNSTSLRTSGDFYVGPQGTNALYAGNTTVKGTFNAGSNAQFTINGAGDVNTSGTITGSKVYGAVYQDIAEAYERDEEEKIEPMEIVYMRDDGKVSKLTDDSYADRVVGVVSEDPFMILGNNLYLYERKCVVALIGKIYVKTNVNDLQIGDIVKASADGAIKVEDPVADFGKILGRVIEPSNNGRVKIRLNMI